MMMLSKIRKMYKDFTRPRNVLVFARVKEGCILKAAATRQHDLVSITADGSALIKMSADIFECNRNWLIKHPLLSCYAELQIIKPKKDE